MTPAELDSILDAMQQAAADNSDLLPGLITVQTSDWINSVSAVSAKCSALHDGLRHRNVQIHIGATHETKVLTRIEAGERGAPYRELSMEMTAAG